MLTLHNYQVAAADHILNNAKSMLAIEMGLGKTASTLSALRVMLDSGEVDRVLVIAPKRVAEHTWPTETKKWGDIVGTFTTVVIAGSPEQRIRNLASAAEVHLIGVDNVLWLVKHYGKAWPYDCVIIDESSLFKDSGSKRFKALKSVTPYIDRCVLLTGTPAPNSLIELWPQIYMLDQGSRLGRTMTAFKDKFFESDYMGWKLTIRPGAEVDIHKRISDLCMSMKAVDYLDMPERIDNVIDVVLPDSIFSKYQQLEKDYLLPLAKGDEITAANAAVLCNKLLQLTQGAPYIDGTDRAYTILHDEKINALREIAETSAGNPILVFYQFKSDLDRLTAAFPKAVNVASPGAIDAWSNGEIQMMLAHPASAGHGLNLQHGGSIVVWFALTWSLELYQQANARLHRQGQTKTVVIHHLVARNTIDEDVMSALRDKATTQDRLINALKRRLTP